MKVIRGKKQEFRDINELDQEIKNIEKAKIEVMQKAMLSDDPHLILKANSAFSNTPKNFDGMDIKSMMVDPLDFMSNFKYKERPTRLTYNMLEKMSKSPITASTIGTRLAQIKKYIDIPKDKFSTGFEIGLRDHEKEATKEDKYNIKKLTDYIINCGTSGFKWGRDDFDEFTMKFINDSLVYDQATFEIVSDRKGNPVEFVATDSSTYRVAIPEDGKHQYKLDPKTGQKMMPSYVQIYQDSVEAEFYDWELCFGVRNPRSDIKTYGYGLAESEKLVSTITSLLWTEEYNRRFFSQGSVPKGIIKVSGNVPDEKLKEFKRQWASQMAGVYNSWKTPIMQADKMDWVDLTKSNKDMEFTQWLYFLIKIHSAIWLIDPIEIGFDITKDRGNSLGTEQNEEKVKFSRDKGLTPILKFFAKQINRHLIWRIDPRYEFRFVGSDVISEENMINRYKDEVTNWKTVDEIRAERDLQPLGDEAGGNLVLNAQWMQWYNNKMLSEQQQEQQGDFGDEEEYDPLNEEEPEEDFGNEDEDVEKGNVFMKDLEKYIGELGNGG